MVVTSFVHFWFRVILRMRLVLTPETMEKLSDDFFLVVRFLSSILIRAMLGSWEAAIFAPCTHLPRESGYGVYVCIIV